MQPKLKRIIVAILAVVLALALCAGLLLVFLPNAMQKSGKVAELSEDNFKFSYVSSLAYSAGTEETSGDKGVYGWDYKPGKEDAEYAFITGIKNAELKDLKANGVKKLILNIPATHSNPTTGEEVPVRYVAQDAFYDCELTIVDINMPLSVYWQIKGNNERFTFDNNSAFARADGETATFTEFKPKTGNGITTLILPSNVWIDTDNDGNFEDGEPTYRYAEYLFAGKKDAAYKNLVVMPDVVNIFNGTPTGSTGNRPKMQGGLLSKSENLESVYFCTGRSEILHLYPLTFENCTALKEISLSAGVYLEDGARVFQGSSSLEKFFVADEKTASAPLFYTVGADGALYTDNYAYSYFTQPNAEKYYEWWKTGLPEDEWKDSYAEEWTPTKAWDSQTKVGELPLTSPTNSKQYGTFEGTGTVSTPKTTYYYASKDGNAPYESGIGIPEGSYVFDVNGTDKKSGSVDNEDDFKKGTGVGQYPGEASFESATLTTPKSATGKGTTATLSADGGTITVTEVGGSDQDHGSPITINGVEYKSRMQLKKDSTRYLEIDVPFTFDLCVYFAGSYAAEKAGTDNPQIALFDSKNFKFDSKSKKEITAKASAARKTLEDVKIDITGGADHLLKIADSKLAGGKYYIAQPSDDEKTSGYAQMYFLVITPSNEQAPSSILVEQNVSLSSDSPNWQRIPNDALLFQKIPDTSYFLDLRYPIVRYDKTCEIPFRVKVFSSTGEDMPSQDIKWEIMNVNGKDVSDNLYMESPEKVAPDENGYFTFTLKLENLFSDSEFYGEGQHKQGRNFAVKFTAGECEQYLFINLMPDAKEKEIPDAAQWQAEYTSGAKPQYLPLTEEKSSRYQTLVSMPAMAKNDVGDYVDSFEFAYHETIEIGPNAFQNTYITVIDIPDRIAKIGASAFRFSNRLQTVYLPDNADIGLNAFGQEPDASPQDGTVYTAGKKNFFLIAPSRTSFEHYLMYADIYDEHDGTKERWHANYNVFPVHVEEEVQGFQNWGGKDPSYDYTPYLTYEITVNFLTYNASGERLQGAETRTFLYGMDAHYVKATATTEWAHFDEKYDNNAPVWFGRIKTDDQEDTITVQQINTLPTHITWSIAADGWYYDEDAELPDGDWYFGERQHVTGSKSAEERMKEFTSFIGGWAGDQVNGKDIRNLAQVHYTEVYNDTDHVQGITETGGEPGDLRKPIENCSTDSDNYYIDLGLDGSEKQTRWNRWWWDEKFENEDNSNGAVVQRFFTMPFAITLKNKSQARENRVEFDVPTFQNIGTITNDEDTMNAVEGADSSWRVPMLTVTFDYNGFPMSRIFENFKSSAMETDCVAWRGLGYADKEWRWNPEKYSSSKAWGDYGDMKYAPDGDDYVPYDAGYYRITVKFSREGLGDYKYYWSGVYNGMRVSENAEIKTTFTFILHIEPRKVPLSNMYAMQYTGQGFSLFEDNPYVDVLSYGDWSGDAKYTAEGLPCAVGTYNVKLKLHDPKYSNPNEDYGEIKNRYTPNLEWEGAAGYDESHGYTEHFENDERINRFIYKDGVDLFIFDGTTATEWGSLWEEGPNGDKLPVTFEAPLAMFGSEVQTYTYTGAPIPLEDVFGGIFSASSIDYTITWNGSTVTEINHAGTYTVSITPAKGYVWWKGIPIVDGKASFLVNEWSLDAFWEEKGGYENHKRDTLTFEVNIDKRPVNVPRNSYEPTEATPPYEFEVPIGGDYEVWGYHMHDFGADEAIPKASDKKAWSANTFDEGVYDVLLRLTDPENTTWAPEAGESHGGNYYVVVRLYAGFDLEKEYPTFQAGLGDVSGNPGADDWVTLTREYDGTEFDIDALFGEIGAVGVNRPSDEEATYTIYKLSKKPDSESDFLLGEEVNTIADAGYYGIIVTLNEPFLYKDTTSTVAYYLVHIGEAKITRNGDDSFWDSEKIFSVDDTGTELKLPDDPTDGNYPLVLQGTNGVNITYHLDMYPENSQQNIEKLNAGEDPFNGEWYAYSEDRLKVKYPGNYCAYVKVEAPNHETYYDCISLHIYNEEFELTLSTTDAVAVYGEGVHTQEALRKAVLEAATSINITGNGNILTKTVDKETLDRDQFHFYFVKDGKEYDFGTAETYLDVGEYELYVRYSWPVGSTEEGKNYITFSWVGGTPKFTVAPRELTLDLGEVTGHTYLEIAPAEWHSSEEFTYNGKTDGAIVSPGGVPDDLQLSYIFKLGEDIFTSLNAIFNAGEYAVEAVCGNPNYKVKLNDTYTYKIAAREITLNPVASVSYNGQERKPAVSFTGLPENIVLLEGTDKSYTLSYAPAEGAELGGTGLPLTAGSYTVTVTLVSKNYTFASGARNATATFVIEMSARPTLNGIGFEDVAVMYDGKPHSITITGTLPHGVSVSYENNGQTEPNIYTVIAAFSDSNGVFETKTATLTIMKASLEFKDDNGNTTLIVDGADGFDPTLGLIIETAEDNITRTYLAWGKDEISEKFTVKLMKNGAEVPLDGKVTVRLLIPEEFRNKEFTLQGIGRAAAVEYTRDGDYVVFEADGLSTYAFTMDGVAYLPILLAAVAISLLSMGTLIVLAILIKKNKKGE